MKDLFFGRRKEMKKLETLLSKRTASLVVIKGRRRIGKSRLIEEFGKKLKTWTFIGLPPEGRVSAQDQRDTFASQMETQLGIRGIDTRDWSFLFWHLSQATQKGRLLLILDEINWMGDKDPTFLGKLKTAWDRDFKKNPNLIVILCGSMSTWIEKNILSRRGFLGRISLDMTLEELPLEVCNQFWHPKEKLISSYEKFKVFSVTGGVPRYLEEIRPEWSAEQIINSLCFEKEGLLFNEFDRIFTDLFSRRSASFRKIVQRLSEGASSLEEVSDALGMKKGGTISKYLAELVMSGFVSADFTWNLKTPKPSNTHLYRLKDNYIRFFLKVIEPNKHKILQEEHILSSGWDSVMGLQFENLVINNRKKVKRSLNINPDHIVIDNPYFQKSGVSKKGCQIDYLIQTKYNCLYICEIKFSRRKVGLGIIREMRKKIDALDPPTKFSIFPVLIHVNGVTDGVLESGFFSAILDFGEFLQDGEEIV
ncbi:MAG: hypothetical protein K940chlam9_01716 [Chlamydiae bacterium]|nr:hypothetical protein [Chlamydiota bacterium]